MTTRHSGGLATLAVLLGLTLTSCTPAQHDPPPASTSPTPSATPAPTSPQPSGRTVDLPREAKCGDSMGAPPPSPVTVDHVGPISHAAAPVAESTAEPVSLIVTSTLRRELEVRDYELTTVVTDGLMRVVALSSWSPSSSRGMFPESFFVPARSHYHIASDVPVVDCRSPDKTRQDALPPGIYWVWFELDGRRGDGRPIHAFGGRRPMSITD